jgi:hypothetical protein
MAVRRAEKRNMGATVRGPRQTRARRADGRRAGGVGRGHPKNCQPTSARSTARPSCARVNRVPLREWRPRSPLGTCPVARGRGHVRLIGTCHCPWRWPVRAAAAVTAHVHGVFVLSSSNIALSHADCSRPPPTQHGGSRGDGPLRPRGPRATGLMTCVRRHCGAQWSIVQSASLRTRVPPQVVLACGVRLVRAAMASASGSTAATRWPAHGGQRLQRRSRRARGRPVQCSRQMCSRAEWQQRGSSVRTISLCW